MSKKTIIIRALTLVAAIAFVAIAVSEVVDGGKTSAIIKSVSLAITFFVSFFGTFISKLDSEQKDEMETEFNKEAIYFEDEKRAKRLFYRGFRGWFAGDYHTAYHYLEKAAKAAQSDRAKSRAYFYIGRCAVQEEKFGRAIEYLNKATQHDRTYAKAWSNLATAYTQSGRLAEAKQACEMGLMYNPQEPYLNNKLGDYYFKTEDYERALSTNLTAERGLPNNCVIVMNVAYAYAGVGDAENAKIKFEKAKSLGYADTAFAWNEISRLLNLHNDVTVFDKGVQFTGKYVLESSCDRIEDCTRDDIERFFENIFEFEDDFISIIPPYSIEGVQFIQGYATIDWNVVLEISVEQADGKFHLYSAEFERQDAEKMIMDFFENGIAPDLSLF